MIDANSKSARFITGTAVLIATGCHALMSIQFATSLGANDVEKATFAVFGASVDVAKVFALAFAAFAWERGRKAKATAALLIWAVAVAYSATAALGFAALARDTIVASRSADADEYRAQTAERTRLIEQLEAGKQSPLFLATYGCTDYNKTSKRSHERQKAEFCSAYWRADARLAEIKPELRKATLTQADPQTMVLAKMTGLPREVIAMSLAIFLAVVAEIVSALGGWAFSRTRRRTV